MSKNKSHKSSLKRIRLTKTGKVKHNRAFGKHLRSHKSGKRLRRLRQDKFMSNPEAKRLEKLLYRRLRGRDQARATLKKSPTPAQRKEAQAAAMAERAKSGNARPSPTNRTAKPAAAKSSKK